MLTQAWWINENPAQEIKQNDVDFCSIIIPRSQHYKYSFKRSMSVMKLIDGTDKSTSSPNTQKRGEKMIWERKAGEKGRGGKKKRGMYQN